MPAPTLPYTTSGTLPYGAGTITPTSGNYTSTSYIVENVTLRDPLTVIERHDVNGAPNGAVGFAEAKTLSGTLQLATTNTSADSMPEVGATFVWPVRGTNTNFFFTEVSTAREIRGFFTAPFSARQVI